MLENSYKVNAKKRHGCLTAYLAALIIVSLVMLVMNLIRSLAPDNEVPFLLVILYSLFILFEIIFAIAIFMWKKWGFWGLCIASVAGFIMSIVSGQLVFLAILDLLVSIGLLVWVVNIGNENKAWPQLE